MDQNISILNVKLAIGLSHVYGAKRMREEEYSFEYRVQTFIDA